jgi:hypothetical protein
MVSIGWSPVGRESVLGILGRWLRRQGRGIGAFLLVALRFVLVVAALGLITLAAYGVAWQLGALAGGVSLLLLEWVVKRR